MAEAYCVKDKRKVEVVNPQRITMKNGKPALQGTCPICGSKVFKIGGADLFPSHFETFDDPRRSRRGSFHVRATAASHPARDRGRAGPRGRTGPLLECPRSQTAISRFRPVVTTGPCARPGWNPDPGRRRPA